VISVEILSAMLVIACPGCFGDALIADANQTAGRLIPYTKGPLATTSMVTYFYAPSMSISQPVIAIR
jgi:hypothetical protein